MWDDRIANLKTRISAFERAIVILESLKMLSHTRHIDEPGFDVYGEQVVLAWYKDGGNVILNLMPTGTYLSVKPMDDDGEDYSDDLSALMDSLRTIGAFSE